MATRSVSPGGALLRASRVFSLPPPLPRPVPELSSQAVWVSDTATLPHPIHQTITTPQGSRKRGDWGFKRPLPLRSTIKTSTPFIRVEAIDTYEHVTEFGSSADHTINLQKWQEMGIPLTNHVNEEKSQMGSWQSQDRKSVFEEDVDVSTGSGEGIVIHEDKRWKFKGPWLAGQTEGEFKEYVKNEVRKRKREFQDYLRAACAKSLAKSARQAAAGREASATSDSSATVDGEASPILDGSAAVDGEASAKLDESAAVDAQESALLNASDVSEAQFMTYLKTLRYDRTELFKHIRDFLDLPPAPPQNVNFENGLSELKLTPGKTLRGSDLLVSLSPYAQHGPPKTHPSAGLAYSRTSAHTPNHPQFGPQKSGTPVQARVVMPKGAATGSFAPVLGVGGFVVSVPYTATSTSSSFKISSNTRNSGMEPIQGLQTVDPTVVGGSKTWVQPKHASINARGHVMLNVELADPEAVSVHEGTTDKIPTRKPTRPFSPATTNYGTSRDTSRGYGLGAVDEFTPSAPQPREPRKNVNDELASLLQIV